METLDGKYCILEEERSTFLLRTENIAYEVKRYKEEMVSIKEQIWSLFEKETAAMLEKHSALTRQFEEFKVDLTKATDSIEREKEDYRERYRQIEGAKDDIRKLYQEVERL